MSKYENFCQLSEYFDRHAGDLTEHAFRLRKNRFQAEQMVSQVFADSFEAIGKGIAIDDLEPWLKRQIEVLAIVDSVHWAISAAT